MVSKALIDLLKEVITSWQVIVVTLVLLLYLAIVFNVARLYSSRSSRRKPKPRKGKSSGAAAAESVEIDEGDSLGLEEG